ncbi:MAG: hypothetical protein IJA67_06565 [Oscillospiraceae bacterium]|nr:hypothetical protein [Oscillospiraceae bacterium]
MVLITVRDPEPGKKLFMRIPDWDVNTKNFQNGVETKTEAGTYYTSADTNILLIILVMPT